MKKILILASAVVLFSSVLTSCKSHGKCAGVTAQAEKVKVSNDLRPY